MDWLLILLLVALPTLACFLHDYLHRRRRRRLYRGPLVRSAERLARNSRCTT